MRNQFSPADSLKLMQKKVLDKQVIYKKNYDKVILVIFRTQFVFYIENKRLTIFTCRNYKHFQTNIILKYLHMKNLKVIFCYIKQKKSISLQMYIL